MYIYILYTYDTYVYMILKIQGDAPSLVEWFSNYQNVGLTAKKNAILPSGPNHIPTAW